MALQKADPKVLDNFYYDNRVSHGRLFTVSNEGAFMIKNAFWFLIGVAISSLLMLVFLYPVIFEKGYKQGVLESYYAKNGLQSPEVYQIAGAGDDGFRKVYEGE